MQGVPLAVRVYVARHRDLDSSWRGQGHCDAVSRLYWITSGRAVVSVGGESITLRPGQLTLLPAFTTFDYACDRCIHQYWTHFHAEGQGGIPLFEMVHCPWQIEVPRVQRQSVQRGFAAIIDGMNEGGVAGEALAAGQLLTLLSRFLRLAIPVDPERARDLARLQEVVQYMRDHLHERVDVAVLAEVMHMERSAFTRLFRRRMGVPPARYLMQLRVEQVKSALRQEPDTTLEALAIRYGFSDAFHCSKAFRRVVGVSPSEFRQRDSVLP